MCVNFIFFYTHMPAMGFTWWFKTSNMLDNKTGCLKIFCHILQFDLLPLIFSPDIPIKRFRVIGMFLFQGFVWRDNLSRYLTYPSHVSTYVVFESIPRSFKSLSKKLLK